MPLPSEGSSHHPCGRHVCSFSKTRCIIGRRKNDNALCQLLGTAILLLLKNKISCPYQQQTLRKDYCLTMFAENHAYQAFENTIHIFHQTIVNGRFLSIHITGKSKIVPSLFALSWNKTKYNQPWHSSYAAMVRLSLTPPTAPSEGFSIPTTSKTATKGGLYADTSADSVHFSSSVHPHRELPHTKHITRSRIDICRDHFKAPKRLSEETYRWSWLAYKKISIFCTKVYSFTLAHLYPT